MSSLPAELLRLSRRLLGRQASKPDQASFRRAISTAYYALFHLLTLEGGRIFVKQASTVELIVRAYDHGKMAKISGHFAIGNLPKKLASLKGRFASPEPDSIVTGLKSVTNAFVKLQEARHDADYDLAKRYDRQEAERFVDLAEFAFSEWKRIRRDDLARIYLSCFLVYEDWNKER
jgi:uncharacterized protein (UPF0332 family)